MINNNCRFYGRATEDPKIVNFDDGKSMAIFSMAIDDSYKDKEGNRVDRAQFPKIVCRGGIAKVAENFVTKGKELLVEAKFTTRKWNNENGEARYAVEFIAEGLRLLGGRDASSAPAAPPQGEGRPAPPPPQDDDDLPF